MENPVKIDQPIVGYAVRSPDAPEAPPLTKPPKWEPIPRSEELIGTTYKLCPPIIDHALYVTINDTTFPDGSVRPIELFINSKSMESFQWVTLLSRLVSALLRQPGPFPDYILEEFANTHDPHGSYFIPGGGGQVDSIAAHIGLIFERHCQRLGLLESKLDEHQQAYLEQKKADLLADNDIATNAIPGATKCGKCGAMAVVQRDGCAVCLECADSKCS